MRKTVGSILLSLAALAPSPAQTAVKVVTTLSSYASIAQHVGGDRVEVHSISRGDEDAHFVKPKPSFALLLKDAEVFVTTGLDLELWAPALVDWVSPSKSASNPPVVAGMLRSTKAARSSMGGCLRLLVTMMFSIWGGTIRLSPV